MSHDLNDNALWPLGSDSAYVGSDSTSSDHGSVASIKHCLRESGERHVCRGVPAYVFEWVAGFVVGSVSARHLTSVPVDLSGGKCACVEDVFIDNSRMRRGFFDILRYFRHRDSNPQSSD